MHPGLTNHWDWSWVRQDRARHACPPVAGILPPPAVDEALRGDPDSFRAAPPRAFVTAACPAASRARSRLSLHRLLHSRLRRGLRSGELARAQSAKLKPKVVQG